MKDIKDINELSGNIKLRLPKSLHAALLRQANFENVSLNQLCLMYLSSGISRGSGNNNLGTCEFNHRLEAMDKETKSDDELFEKLEKLNDEVERIKPLLMHELEGVSSGNKRFMSDYVEVLRAIYPIFQGNIAGEKLPMLKLPSAKIVIRPKDKEKLKFECIEKEVKAQCQEATVLYGDFDIFRPMEKQVINQTHLKSISVHFYCDFCRLKELVEKTKEALCSMDIAKKMDISVKPSFLQIATRALLKSNEGHEEPLCGDQILNE